MEPILTKQKCCGRATRVQPRTGKLLDYFNDRHVWLVEPDVTPPRLNPYPAPDAGLCPAKE